MDHLARGLLASHVRHQAAAAAHQARGLRSRWERSGETGAPSIFSPLFIFFLFFVLFRKQVGRLAGGTPGFSLWLHVPRCHFDTTVFEPQPSNFDPFLVGKWVNWFKWPVDRIILVFTSEFFT